LESGCVSLPAAPGWIVRRLRLCVLVMPCEVRVSWSRRGVIVVWWRAWRLNIAVCRPRGDATCVFRWRVVVALLMSAVMVLVWMSDETCTVKVVGCICPGIKQWRFSQGSRSWGG